MLPTVGSALGSVFQTYGAKSKTAWRDYLYEKQTKVAGEILDHRNFKRDFKNQINGLKTEFQRTIAQAYQHYDGLTELSHDQQQAFQTIKSFVISQNIDVEEAANTLKIDIPSAHLEDIYSMLSHEARRLSKESYGVKKALDKFKNTWTKIEKISASGQKELLRNDFILAEKAATAAQAIEVLAEKFEEWDQKALVREVRLYEETVEQENKVEALIPGAQAAQGQVVEMLKERGEDVFEAAYLLGHLKKYPSITYDAFGNTEEAEKSPNTLAKKFVVGAAVKIEGLLTASDDHWTTKLNENLDEATVSRAQAFTSRLAVA